MNARHRRNLLKLATYLESLPADYAHFDMTWFADHRGACDLPMKDEVYAAKEPRAFLQNCGTVACAVGHGPAAGIGVRDDEYFTGLSSEPQGVDWHDYSKRVFGISGNTGGAAFTFLFGANWESIDNTHYGAAARIRYFLETGDGYTRGPRTYARYRKGSRSAKRREIEAA